ncbi:MAG TPA: hypothetical protein VN108_01200 [Marmoricola sp.]|nr:hypothetical protein [Marmoricola sp.]
MAGKRNAGPRVERLVSVLASIVGLAGLAAVGYGVWLIFEPAGYVIGGVELLILSWRLS